MEVYFFGALRAPPPTHLPSMNDSMWRALKMADGIGVKALDATLDSFDWCAVSPSEKITASQRE